MRVFTDFQAKSHAAGLEIFQLTSDSGVPSAHLYPEAPAMSPDGTKLLLHRHADAHAGNYLDPLHRYELCDLADGGALRPLTDEPRASAPSMSPCGRWVYYFVDQTDRFPGRVLLRRLEIETWERMTVVVLDGNLPGTKVAACEPIYGLATIRQDGAKLAIGARLAGGRPDYPETGLLVFDVAGGSAEMILHGPSFLNMHMQYCRSPDAEGDLLVQENHGVKFFGDGKRDRLVSDPGCDIHVVRDDGMDMRTLAWGRVPTEHCRGHQCWRGNTGFALGAMSVLSGPNETGEVRLREGLPVRHADHLGAATPDGNSHEVSAQLRNPRIDHFATDITGERLISDGLFDDGWKIQLSRLGPPMGGFLHDLTTLLDLGATSVHPHPFFSPDGRSAFFNSDATGTMQAFMIRNLP